MSDEDMCTDGKPHDWHTIKAPASKKPVFGNPPINVPGWRTVECFKCKRTKKVSPTEPNS
jgi:hypothetical protein